MKAHMDLYTIVFVVVISSLINVLSWIAIGYLVGSYFAKYSRCGKLCAETAAVFGSLTGGLLAFTAYGLPTTLLWANNVFFALIGSLGFVYISLPEKERAVKVEHWVSNLKKLSHFSLDLASFKR